MNLRRIIIVGPSGSGTSSVGREVARELGVPLFSLDEFRARGKRNAPYLAVGGLRVRNFEHPDNWDGNALSFKMLACVRNHGGFVAEGNHLLVYPNVASIAETERFYLDVPFKVSLERRKSRHRYLPADESFALIGEDQTRLWVWPQQALPGITILDGTKPVIETVAAILTPKSRLVRTMDV